MIHPATSVIRPHVALYNPPRKILYVIDTLEVGGSERSLLETARRLDRQRFEMVVCHIYRGDALRGDFEAAGVRVVSLNLGGKYEFFKAFRRLKKLAVAEEPDLIHTTLFRSNQVGRAVGRWLGIPVMSSFVSLSYDASRTRNNTHVNPHKLACLQLIDMWTAAWVARFHSVSEAVADSMCAALRIAPQRVSVVHRGRDADAFEKAPEWTLQELREKWNLNGAFPCIANVGRLVEAKAHWALIDAMPDVLREFPTAKLLIAGEGRLRTELESQISELQLERHVSLLGASDQIVPLLHLADCFAFPSLYEGLPGSVVEAMLAGCPIVAADIPVIREVISHEDTGLLVPPKSSTALAEAILRVARDPGSGGAPRPRRAPQGAQTVRDQPHRAPHRRPLRPSGAGTPRQVKTNTNEEKYA